jgi:predicted ArsR family transcriptional regulator
MQKTRQQIIDILNHHGRATVQEIVKQLRQRRGDYITAVTVRHHLNLLQGQNLISTIDTRHQNKPGRPQHIYELTEAAQDHLPSNYQHLIINLIERLEQQLEPTQVNVIFEGIADSMAAKVDLSLLERLETHQRLEAVAEYLNSHGYDATWEHSERGFLLHTSNCPYHEVAKENDVLCQMDLRLISALMGIVPRRQSLVSCGEATCSYLFPHESTSN